ncbi:unnamed protein product [Ixodes hexagonus]
MAADTSILLRAASLRSCSTTFLCSNPKFTSNFESPQTVLQTCCSSCPIKMAHRKSEVIGKCSRNFINKRENEIM